MNDFVLNNDIQTRPKQTVVGRFAPSPSGPLHFGSLIAAVGSYLHAKANHGLWLVRIEDIDPPREIKGASKEILNTLEDFGLCWDESVVYQSQRSDDYRAVLAWLQSTEQAYLCQCSRKQIQQNSRIAGIYQRTCRHLALSKAGCAVRFKNDHPCLQFNDPLQGPINPTLTPDDFIIHRKDGLFAYQLAVVVDDILQGVTDIVRGSDLLSTTLHQMTLYHAFGQPTINYLHLPVAVSAPGKKLSKQNHASAVDRKNPATTLIKVFEFLGLQPPVDEIGHNKEALLRWGIEQWSIDKLPKQSEIQVAIV